MANVTKLEKLQQDLIDTVQPLDASVEADIRAWMDRFAEALLENVAPLSFDGDPPPAAQASKGQIHIASDGKVYVFNGGSWLQLSTTS